MILATIRPCKVVDPNSLKRKTAFITTSNGTALKADSPGSSCSQYSTITALVSYCPVYKRN